MPEEKSRNTIPLATLITLTLAAAGSLLTFNNLKSDRPESGDAPRARSPGNQDVPARLWQDPFQAAGREGSTSTTAPLSSYIMEDGTSPGDRRAPAALGSKIRSMIDYGQRKSVLLLPVLIPSDPHAEWAEHRLRCRVAVLEALGVSGFEPEDGEHIGFIRVPWSWKKIEATEWGKRKDSEIVSPLDPLLVPYECCRPAEIKMPGTHLRYGSAADRYSGIVVLWVPEEALSTETPLRRLRYLVKILVDATISKTSKTAGTPLIEVKIVGPRTSTTLHAMAVEAKTSGASMQGQSGSDHGPITMYSATATAAEELITIESGTPEAFGNGLEAFGFELVRLTKTDDSLFETLMSELKLRGVRVYRNKKGDPTDHVALVSEWDTFYGRAIPATFIARAASKPLRQIIQGASFAPWIHPFVYLRGVDGKTVGQGEKKVASELDTASRKAPLYFGLGTPEESPEGTNQTDYLRRLADKLYELDRSLIHDGCGGLKAVGVLGSDVYDKLLVMRALRDHLPHTLFFTTDVDARYAMSCEWSATHNLIISSPYGLRLHQFFQRNVPPFRDSYQTAIFAGTLAAVGDLKVDDLKSLLGPARRFEVGRDGLHDLTVDNYRGRNLVDPSEISEDRFDSPPARIHPPRYDQREWFGRWWYVLLGLLVLALVVAIGVGFGPPRTLRLKGPLLFLSIALGVCFCGLKIFPADDAWLIRMLALLALSAAVGRAFGLGIGRKKIGMVLSSMAENSPLCILFGVPVVLAVMYWFVTIAGPQGEVFAPFQGISVWLSEAIRWLAIVLAVHFLANGIRRTQESDIELESFSIYVALRNGTQLLREVRRDSAACLADLSNCQIGLRIN